MTSTWETRPKVFCAEIGCPQIPDSAYFDHQPGCFWFGVTVVPIEFPQVAEEDLDPEGKVCGWCGGVNEFFDDIGWIYITPVGDDTRPCCEKCWWGPNGDLHRQRYGVGER